MNKPSPSLYLHILGFLIDSTVINLIDDYVSRVRILNGLQHEWNIQK